METRRLVLATVGAGFNDASGKFYSGVVGYAPAALLREWVRGPGSAAEMIAGDFLGESPAPFETFVPGEIRAIAEQAVSPPRLLPLYACLTVAGPRVVLPLRNVTAIVAQDPAVVVTGKAILDLREGEGARTPVNHRGTEN